MAIPIAVITTMHSSSRSPWLKWGFLLSAGVGVGVALAVNWTGVQAALENMALVDLALTVSLSFTYVFATMLSWRAIMRDLGEPLSLAAATRLFFLSQIGKYIPGGIWNVIAVGEMGRSVGVHRRTSVSSMLVFWLVSVATGLVVGWSIILSSDVAFSGQERWIVWILPVAVVMMSPPVLRRILNLGLACLRRDPLVRQPTTRGLVLASLWALVGWVLAGAQVWVLARALSDQSVPSFSTALGGYALAWTAGFLIVFAPAGAGVREVVLAGLFAGSMGAGAVVALVLVSRALITGADLMLAAVGGLMGQRMGLSHDQEP